MSDLIERLRAWPNLPGLSLDADLMREAADALEAQHASYCHSQQQFVDAQAELTRLRSQLEASEADARRYRKWREDYCAPQLGDGISDLLIALADAWTPPEVDAAIDAAALSEPTEPTEPTEEKR